MALLETFRADDSTPIRLQTAVIHGWWAKMDNVTTLMVGAACVQIDVLMPLEAVDKKMTPKSPTRKNPGFRNRLDAQHFARLWEVYPRREGKQDAIRAWGKCLSLPALPVLLDAVERAKRSEQWQDLSKVPHLSTFINGRRWEDETRARNGQEQISVTEVLEEIDSVRNTFRIV